ncbi:MAG TPA: nicotinate phosphoribosyltransferase [Afifellaceae bacterium]|nr:nicotinate phosphoribosyltransferase [Afifellaceae bacterium]
MSDRADKAGPGSTGGEATPHVSGLFADFYELTMAHAYFREGMAGDATFTLFVRRLPEGRNYLIACGLETLLAALEGLAFGEDDLHYLGTLGFPEDFRAHLREFRFTGQVFAVPEGTPVFANEPILEVVAPILQAQLIETLAMNQVHLQTLLASKAARIVAAAQGRAVVDFGARRMHGFDAAMKAARAFHVAGVQATSNTLAGKVYGIPVSGTMAHSYIQAHDSEAEAFAAFARTYPDTVLLVDTYDTLDGVRRVIALAGELGDAFRVRAVRLDSGDLAALAVEARRMLDAAGLTRVQVFASGSLDEWRIAELLASGAPIDGFGVGTRMGVSKDAPDLDIVYKLTEYSGRGRLKLSIDKPVLPGRKQIFRVGESGRAVRDVIGRAEETLDGRPLLVEVMRGGRRLPGAVDGLDAARQHAARELALLPEPVRGLAPAEPPYPVEISPALQRYQREVTEEIKLRHLQS